MAATINPLLTRINDSETLDNWSALGGGASGLVLEIDFKIQGNSSVSKKITGAGTVKGMWYDIGDGNQIDFTTLNRHFYIWIYVTTSTLIDVIANGGIRIRLGTTTSDWAEWYVGGSDTYAIGGWTKFVIDPNKTPSNFGGSFDPAIVRYFGAMLRTTGTVKAENLAIDAMDYGTGLQVEGTSSINGVWQDILDADAGNPTNMYGIVREIEGIIFVKGEIVLGDDGGNNSDLDDEDRVIVWENPQYYQGAGLYSCITTTLYKLTAAGNAGGATSIVQGNKVGAGDTAVGANGVSFQSAGPVVTIDFSGLNVDTVEIYGCKFLLIAGGITLSATVTHEFIGNVVDQCGQVDPKQTIIRNCSFSGTTDDGSNGSALLWNATINIKNCGFNANTHVTNDPHAIQHDVADAYDYDNLTFTGNDYDVDFTVSGTLDISKINGSNPSSGDPSGGGTINFLLSVTLKIIVKDEGGNPIENAQVGIFRQSNMEQLMNEDTLATGIAEETFDYGAGPDVDIYLRIRKSSVGATKYIPISTVGTITADGFAYYAVLIEDEIAI